MTEPRSAFEESWRRRFERFAAGNTSDSAIAGWSEAGLALRLDFFQSLWRAPRRGLWLDAGCGAGAYSRFLAGSGQAVVGLDYAHQPLLRARERSPGVSLWLCADITLLPFRPESFDGVISYGVLQALSRSGPAVAQLQSMLRPGGEIWIDGLNAWSVFHPAHRLREALAGRAMLVRYERPGVIRRALREAGLRDIRIHYVPVAPARLRRVAGSRFVRWLVRLLPPLGALICHAFVVRARKPAPSVGG